MTNKPFNLGLIVRMDDSGLGNQTRNLAKMLKPDRLLIIDSTPFNGRPQHPEWYKNWPINQKMVARGFPSQAVFARFLYGLDAVVTCETPYGYDLFRLAQARGVKTYLQYNYEFLDYLQQEDLPQPTALLAPSEWGVDDIAARTGMVPTLLRPPLFLEEFARAYVANAARSNEKRRFLHIVGTAAVHDRNGTDSVIRAVELSSGDFELVIKAQKPIDITTTDPRVTYDFSPHPEVQSLYEGFDALIMPRRYGGLCLPMNEALASGLPVIMTDVSPNNDVLPQEWLIQASPIDTFMTRTMITVYEADAHELARKLDDFAAMSSHEMAVNKEIASSIATTEFSADSQRLKYETILKK